MIQAGDQSAESEKVWTAPFIGLTSFLGIYYLSPEDYFPSLEGAPLAKVIAAATFIVTIAQNLSAGRPWLTFTRESKLFSIFIAIMLVGIPFSVWPGGSTEVFTAQIVKLLMLLLLFGNCLRSPRQVSVLMRCLVAFGILIAVVSCYHYVIGELDRGRLIGYGSKEYRNPNDLSIGLLILIPLSAACFAREKQAARKSMFALAIGVMGMVIILSLSRQGMLGLAFLSGLTLWTMGKKNPAKALLVCALLVAFCFAVLASSPTLADRVASIFDSDMDDTGSKAERLSHMNDGLVLTLEHPLMGVGLGQSVVAIVGMHNNAANQWRRIHNTYILVSAELGLPGLVAYVFMIFSTLGCLKKVCEAELQQRIMNEPAERVATSLRWAVLVFMFAACFSPVAYNWYLFILIGLSGAFLSTVRKPEQAYVPFAIGHVRSFVHHRHRQQESKDLSPQIHL